MRVRRRTLTVVFLAIVVGVVLFPDWERWGGKSDREVAQAVAFGADSGALRLEVERRVGESEAFRRNIRAWYLAMAGAKELEKRRLAWAWQGSLWPGDGEALAEALEERIEVTGDDGVRGRLLDGTQEFSYSAGMAANAPANAAGPALASAAVLLVPAAALLAVLSTLPLPPLAKTILSGGILIATVCVAFLLLRRHPVRVKGDDLLIRATVGYQRIPLSAITGISKVRRKKKGAGAATEHVEIAYEDTGTARTLLVSPPDPMTFVLELVSHCPHLSAYQETRLIKDGSFKDALGDED